MHRRGARAFHGRRSGSRRPARPRLPPTKRRTGWPFTVRGPPVTLPPPAFDIRSHLQAAGERAMGDIPRPRSRRTTAFAEPLEARVLMTAVPLDPSFGDAGIVQRYLPGRGGDHANAIVLDAAGNAVVGGVTGGATGHGAALARYRPDGSLDPSFGDGGTTVWRPAGRSSSIAALGLQRDGKIVAAGYAHSASPEGYTGPFTLARFNRDGSPDPSFGEGGAAVFP